MRCIRTVRRKDQVIRFQILGLNDALQRNRHQIKKRLSMGCLLEDERNLEINKDQSDFKNIHF